VYLFIRTVYDAGLISHKDTKIRHFLRRFVSLCEIIALIRQPINDSVTPLT